MNQKSQSKLQELYDIYNNTVKPLLIEVESKYQYHPLPLFNEIRSFTDHIARCYRKDVSEEYAHDELLRSEGHLNRIIFDCFKFLNVYFHDELIKFEKKTKNINLATVKDGVFYIEYMRMRKEIISTLRDAKKAETKNREDSFLKYEEAYNKFSDLDEYIYEHIPAINRARVLFSTRRILKFIGWLTAAIIAGIISSDKIIRPIWNYITNINLPF